MKGFLHWFKNSTKIKRWLFLIIIGMITFCYGISQIIVLKELGVNDIIQIIIAFAIGLTFVITGFIFSQKRLLEIVIEASAGDKLTRHQNNIKVESLIFNKKVYNLGPKIVVIGGGAGLSTVLSGLKHYTNNITAIVPVIDHNKQQEYSRRELDLMPETDITNSLISLAKDDVVMEKLLNYKFENGILRNMKFGNIYLSIMREIYASFPEGVEKSSKTLNIIGNVIPVTYDEMTLCAELENDMTAEGEDEIRRIAIEKITSIKRVYLSPANLRPVSAAIKAIQEADAIIIGPGGLYTDVIPNLLVRDIAKTIKKSKAARIYISNIMTEPGQTDSYSLYDHIQKIQEHAGIDIIDYCICDTGEIIPEFVRRYNQKGSEIIQPDTEKLKSLRINIIQDDLSIVQEDHIRHDSKKLAENIIQIILERLSFANQQNGLQYFLLRYVLKLKHKETVKRRPAKRLKDDKNKSSKTANNTKTKSKSRSKSKFNEKYSSRIKSIKDSDLTRQQNLEMSKKIEKIAEESKAHKKK